jgi:hypothetical protein
MNYEKALYFVTKEKKVQHVGFFTTLTKMHLVESKDMLEQQGFSEDPDFLRETDDSAYIFSSHIPQPVVAMWFEHFCSATSALKKVEREKEREKKRKNENKGIRKKRKRKKKKKRSKTLPATMIKKPPRADIKKIQNRRTPSQKPLPTKVSPQNQKKTPEILKEEIKAQRKWETFVPTCSECTFWNHQYLAYTDTDVGVCSVTSNFVSAEKKACSEFERQQA